MNRLLRFAILFWILGAATALLAQEPPTLRSVDVFGTEIFSGDDVAREFKTEIASIASAFAKFPPDPDQVAPAAERIETELKSRGSFALLHFGVTFAPAPDNGLYVMIDVVETKDVSRRMPFRAAPTESLPDPAGLIAKWGEYQDKVFSLMFSGTALQISSCPVIHCLAPFSLPELAPYLPVFNDGATAHETELYDIVARDKRAERRASALFLLAHTNNPAKLLPVLTRSMKDPEDGVRNNAMRIMMQMALMDPDRDYPIQDLISALQFPGGDDRNKSAYVLAALVKSPRYRDAIQKDAVPSLLKLLRLHQVNNHDPAYQILKELSGKDYGDRDYSAWENWAASK
jgi:hypothetical protein